MAAGLKINNYHHEGSWTIVTAVATLAIEYLNLRVFARFHVLQRRSPEVLVQVALAHFIGFSAVVLGFSSIYALIPVLSCPVASLNTFFLLDYCKH